MSATRGWGGHRARAGAKRQHPFWERLDVAHDYAAKVDIARVLKRRPNRRAIIEKLAREHGMTPRYVVRCVDEFAPEFRAAKAAIKQQKLEK
jgi:hypothetical protein